MVLLSQLTSNQRPSLADTESLLEAREQTEAIHTELTAVRDELGALRNELDETRAALQAKSEMLADRDSVIARTQSELTEARQGIVRRDSEIERSQLELAEAQRNISLTAAELQQARAELHLARDQFTEKANKARELTEKVTVAEQQIERYEADMNDARKELEATTGELAKATEELRVLKKEVMEQENIIAQLRARTLWQVLFERDAIQTEKRPSFKEDATESREGRTFWLEHPTGPSAAGKPVVVSGWVVTPSGERIEGVEAVVAGKGFSGMSGLERPDVAAAHQERSDYHNSGFIIEVPLPCGSHRVALRYLTGSQGWVTFCSFQHDVEDQTKPSSPDNDAGKARSDR
jgi:predicted  nucleic acid-binding Zn-ribbon protein